MSYKEEFDKYMNEHTQDEIKWVPKRRIIMRIGVNLQNQPV